MLEWGIWLIRLFFLIFLISFPYLFIRMIILKNFSFKNLNLIFYFFIFVEILNHSWNSFHHRIEVESFFLYLLTNAYFMTIWNSDDVWLNWDSVMTLQVILPDILSTTKLTLVCWCFMGLQVCDEIFILKLIQQSLAPILFTHERLLSESFFCEKRNIIVYIHPLFAIISPIRTFFWIWFSFGVHIKVAWILAYNIWTIVALDRR